MLGQCIGTRIDLLVLCALVSPKYRFKVIRRICGAAGSASGHDASRV